MSHLNPRTPQFETEMRHILDLQSIAQNMPDAFIDLAKVTRSHIPTANTPTKIDVLNVRCNNTLEGQIVPEGGVAAPPTRQSTLVASQLSTPTLKHGRPLIPKDSQLRKRKMAQTSHPSLNMTIVYSYVPTYEVILDYGDVLDKTTRPLENREISVRYTVLDEVWNRNEMIVDNAFMYTVASNIILSNLNHVLLMNVLVKLETRNPG